MPQLHTNSQVFCRQLRRTQSVVRWTSTWKGAVSSPIPGKVVSENLNVTIRPIN